ncbi:MAG: arsenite methyltransferase [Candidatus Riflebacteria bacterium]|nr:arsenite methyltransferase [Candidatus Riflebacteria bacterium]
MSPKKPATLHPDHVRISVRDGYGKIARGQGSCCGSSAAATSSCCGSAAPAKLAKDLGYQEADLATIPEGANLGLSCGNPTALAALQPGEVVLDLGSGGGFDCFVAAPRVGPTGRVIGVDMTPDMIARARGQIGGFKERTGLANVEFRLGEIEHLPVADQSVDVVISNCVLNLSPDKGQVWREIFRVLRPGGRVAISDLALRRPLPPAIRDSVAALVGCIAGAPLIEETRAWMAAAGFDAPRLTEKPQAIDAMLSGSEPLPHEILAALPKGMSLAEYVTSLAIDATRPSMPAVGPRR